MFEEQKQMMIEKIEKIKNRLIGIDASINMLEMQLERLKNRKRRNERILNKAKGVLEFIEKEKIK